jgi:hypothetical protein
MSRSGGFAHPRLRRLHDGLAGYVERGEVVGLVAMLCRRDEVHVETIGLMDLARATPMHRR